MIDTTSLLLTQADLQRCGATDIDRVGAALEQCLIAHEAGTFTAPPSSFLKRPECPHVADRIIGLAGHLGAPFDIEGLKWVASAHQNPERGLPRANAVIVLNDPETRLPLAIMEGGLISAMRTAVVQALAARYLARPDSTSMGLVGAGRIGALTVWAIKQWFPDISTIRVFDLSARKAHALCEHMAGLNIAVEAVSSFNEALIPADIGIAATTAFDPWVTPECFKEGSLFLNVSLMDPTFDMVGLADKIIVDDWEQCIHSDRVLARMHREGLVDRNSIHGEFGEIISGKLPGREFPEERIFFNPFGLAIEDLAVSKMVYDRAIELGVGQRIQLVDEEWNVLF